MIMISKTPPVLKVDETMVCKDCDTMHYIEHGKVFEFTPTRVKRRLSRWTLGSLIEIHD